MHTHEKMKTCSPESDSAADDIINPYPANVENMVSS